MIELDYDVSIIGGGPAGLAAALSAKKNGAEKILILDRNSWFGGILSQCIHDGFGVEETGKSMTGPEYAEIYIESVKKEKIDLMKETMVLNLDKNKTIIAINKKGIHKINSKSVILSMGCREKTRWNIMVPGDRPSGIYTAGVAQAFVNLYNILPGKNVLILGSGDVGLIIARRLKFEGVNVLGVVEILPYASGLPRNVVQCLDDYDIPLYLNHTVCYIKGNERLESVIIAQVDEDWNIIESSKKEIKCDTLILSLGLIPENELSKDIGIKIDKNTGGPIVNQFLETSVQNIFACGNCLQVYDTVDLLSSDAKIAGKYAAQKEQSNKNEIFVQPGEGIRQIVPQVINKAGKIKFNIRVSKPYKSKTFYLKVDNKIIYKKKINWANPANMISFSAEINSVLLKSNKTMEALLDD